MNDPDPASRDVIRAWFRIRASLGWLGLALPLVLIGGGWASQGAVEPSLSDYYHTLMRDAFVGVLTAMGLFLIAYPGQSGQERLSDDLITTAAGIAAFGVAFFPNEVRTNANLLGSITQQALGYKLAAGLHYVSAVVFLSGLAALCLRRFARSGGQGRVYRLCGWAILVLAAVVIAASALKLHGPQAMRDLITASHLILWSEAAAIWAFALAWLLRGRDEAASLRAP